MGKSRNLKGNVDYTKSFSEFQEKYTGKGPVLLPINVDIEDGIISRRRLTAKEVREIYGKHSDELAEHCALFGSAVPGYYTDADFKRMFKAYDKAFSDDDNQGMYPDSPLNFVVRRHAVIMFSLGRSNWKFTKKRHVRFNNDRNDLARNCAQICTLGGRQILLVENRCINPQPKMSYDLFVTVRQREEGKTLYTDIIIDPGMDNDDDGDPGLPPNGGGGVN